jgi:shikimate kinase
MAAGKTTVARALSARLGWRAEDVDELIEARERRPIADIFAKQGEPYFREVEREILKLLLPLRHAIVATGGGTFMDADTRTAINLDGLSVWLDVPFERLLARIPADGRRPLAADRVQLERLFTARQAAYAQAHLRIEAGAAPAEELAEQILDRMATL